MSDGNRRQDNDSVLPPFTSTLAGECEAAKMSFFRHGEIYRWDGKSGPGSRGNCTLLQRKRVASSAPPRNEVRPPTLTCAAGSPGIAPKDSSPAAGFRAFALKLSCTPS